MRITNSLPAIAAATVAVALTVAGCTSSSSSGGTGTGTASSATSGAAASATSTTSASAAAQSGVMSNAADATFVQEMYPHHAQAIAMAAMVNGRTTTPAVVQLATTIKGEQQPEMDHMTVLQRSLGKPAAATMPDMPGMDQNGGGPGMSGAAEFPDLDGLSGTAFDQKWLTMMTEHHQGAITMATTELGKGTNPDAKQLATNIISAQKSEIQHMSTLIHS
ncbi:MAG: DUF305 domain-containing protein [Mycobacteriaceae bacterium]